MTAMRTRLVTRPLMHTRPNGDFWHEPTPQRPRKYIATRKVFLLIMVDFPFLVSVVIDLCANLRILTLCKHIKEARVREVRTPSRLSAYKS